LDSVCDDVNWSRMTLSANVAGRFDEATPMAVGGGGWVGRLVSGWLVEWLGG
jgi:hypothetical protein